MADPAEAPRSILDVSRFLHEPNCRVTGHPYGTDTWFAGWVADGPQCCQPCQTHWLLDQLADVEADRARLQQENAQANRELGDAGRLIQTLKAERDEAVSQLEGVRDELETALHGQRWYPRAMKAEAQLAQFRHALTQLPRYWVWIDRAFPEPMACLGELERSDGPWVKYEDVEKALTP